jgi:hypothetical protein
MSKISDKQIEFLSNLKQVKLPKSDVDLEVIDKHLENNTLSAEQMWQIDRWGKITGSRIKALLTNPRTRKTVIGDIELNEEKLALLSEQFSNYDTLMGVKYFNARDRGHYWEKPAVEHYNNNFLEKNTPRFVQVDYEIIVSKKNKKIAVSPDAYKKDKDTGKIKQALEVKCLEDKNHLKMFNNLFVPKKDEKEKDPNEQIKITEYYPQLIQYFVVLPDVEKVIIYFFNHFANRKKLKGFRVELDRKKYIDDIEKQETKLNKIVNEVGQAVEIIERSLR